MRTSVPSTLENPANVTLLGNAIHSMTPSLGRGANLAMRPGALFGRHLRKIAEGEGTLAVELGYYEKSMTEHVLQGVREAAEMGQQRTAHNPLPHARTYCQGSVTKVTAACRGVCQSVRGHTEY